MERRKESQESLSLAGKDDGVGKGQSNTQRFSQPGVPGLLGSCVGLERDLRKRQVWRVRGGGLTVKDLVFTLENSP